MSLKTWFGKGPKGDWVDIGAPKKKGKVQKCGRKSAKGGSKRPYPACRPTKAQCTSASRKKTGPKRISWKKGKKKK